jgi:hypothetical protein
MGLFSKGNVLAASVAALFACGGSSSSNEPVTPASTETVSGDDGAAAGTDGAEAPAMAEQVKCVGINECKGMADCHGEGHSCKGQNECKGKGWVMASTDDCSAKGGTALP